MRCWAAGTKGGDLAVVGPQLPMVRDAEKALVLAERLADSPRQVIDGTSIPVAASISARLLGLSHLDREVAGVGLLIPGCRSVHTFGMRFELDILFLDKSGAVVRRCLGVPPRRCLFTKEAQSVLELVPVLHEGGEVRPPVA